MKTLGAFLCPNIAYDLPVRGMIVNTADEQRDCWEDRDQVPCFYLDDGTPIFEVWFWHRGLRRWFCMSTVPNDDMIAQGVVYFWPGDIVGLKSAMTALEEAAGIKR